MSKKHYSKTKIEHITLLNGLIERYGDIYELILQRVDQANNFSMYTAKMSVDATFAFIKRLPRDYENLDGVQRALKLPKINSIKKLATEDPAIYSQPNAVVISLGKPNSTEDPIVSIGTIHNFPELLVYKINLKRMLKRVKSAQVDSLGYIINEKDLFFGTLIDAHHRLEGLFAAERFTFEVPVTVYLDLPRNEIYRVFININKFQDKPSNVHTLAIEQEAGIFADEEEQSKRIISMLNTDMDNTNLELGMDEKSSKQPQWSILFDRIKTVDAKRPAKARKIYVTNSTFDKLIKDNLFDVVSKELSVNRKAEILNDYFLAWSKCFPVAWEDTKNHVLVKSMGFQIMMKLFPTIYAPLSYGRVPTQQDFIDFINRTLNNGEPLMMGDTPFDIEWDSDTFGGYSSGKGIGQIVKTLKGHINSQAQTAATPY
ncbi:hypothetical protein [Niallia taxi]|uniref:hypothetical protein n=1 Tax=Niallia taxi TaxID=2499688 RepID=UPI002E1A1CB7|nr:hypothetical protein [Niallia taxi]